MKESNDWSMNFAEVDGKIVVDQVLLKLQTIITYNGKNYGPYLPSPYNGVPSASHYFPTWNKSTGGRYDGWKIVIYKKEKNVSVVPSENGNIVLFE